MAAVRKGVRKPSESSLNRGRQHVHGDGTGQCKRGIQEMLSKQSEGQPECYLRTPMMESREKLHKV